MNAVHGDTLIDALRHEHDPGLMVSRLIADGRAGRSYQHSPRIRPWPGPISKGRSKPPPRNAEGDLKSPSNGASVAIDQMIRGRVFLELRTDAKEQVARELFNESVKEQIDVALFAYAVGAIQANAT